MTLIYLFFWSAAYTARESLEYWHGSIDLWYKLIPSMSKHRINPSDEIMWISWREVALRDVAGAAGGCLAGAAVGLVFASGATCPSGALMVGTAMSVHSAVYQVLDHVIPK